jgi:hypothetical protein
MAHLLTTIVWRIFGRDETRLMLREDVRASMRGDITGEHLTLATQKYLRAYNKLERILEELPAEECKAMEMAIYNESARFVNAIVDEIQLQLKSRRTNTISCGDKGRP